ncbi:313_t:CDS:2 [Ambispora gerdemannii]|uniref:313_t:CDS:1 n=1 Tax=Ambispora gerdemannii TaxID=144530 RepID=A0A9N9AQL8_9GLOM|nr:313_t:CDS:2 [Ambispora gerdemannii]
MGNCIFKQKEQANAANSSSSITNPLNQPSTTSTISTDPSSVTKNNNCNISHEINMLTNHHYVLKETWENTNFSAPVTDILKNNALVLDLGCGSGTWVLDMATEYNTSNFIGVDSASFFPKQIRPMNTNFHQLNVLDGLPWNKNHFDFVYQKMMSTLFAEDDYQKQIHEIVRITKPGGWIEIMETNIELNNSGPVTTKVLKGACKILESGSINVRIGAQIRRWFQECGLVNLRFQEKATPLGQWGNHLGVAAFDDMLMSLKKLQSCLLKNLGITEKEFESIVNVIKSETREQGTSSFLYSFSSDGFLHDCNGALCQFKSGYGAWNLPKSGPSFGGGCDLTLFDEERNISYCHVESYEYGLLDDIFDEEDEYDIDYDNYGNHYGPKHFTVKEYEVFQVI